MLGAENQRPTSPDVPIWHRLCLMAWQLIQLVICDRRQCDGVAWPNGEQGVNAMLQETLWPDLDYLVLDMPPGPVTFN